MRLILALAAIVHNTLAEFLTDVFTFVERT